VTITTEDTGAVAGTDSAEAVAAPPALPRQRDFRLLWTGYAASAVGTEVTLLAMPLAAAVLLGATPLQMGLLTAAGTLPYLGLGLLAGVWVDRMPRRRPVLVATDLVAAAGLLSVPAAWGLGVLTVAQLIAVELVVGTCRVLFRPAYQAHLPDVVRREQLTLASGHLRAADSGAMLAGPGLGGLLVQVLSAPLAVMVDAVSFLVSAICIRRVRAPERVDFEPAPRRPLRVELAEGMQTLLRDGSLRAIAGTAANLNLFGMMLMALFVVYATRELGFSPGLVAGVVMAGGLGALAGALLAPRVAGRIGAGRTIVLASVAFSGALYAFPAAVGPAWAEFAVIAGTELLVGIAVMLFDVTVAGLVLTVVPRERLGRVNASLSFVTQGVKPLGALAGGMLGTAIGLRPALWVAAVGVTTTVLWSWFSPLRRATADA
jgi:MFS family permease